MAKVHPNGTPLTSMIQSILNSDKDKNLISVLSMNLLAPVYVRSIDKRTGGVQSFAAFEWVKDDAILEWDTRKIRLLEYMIASQAQVICLQELQLERFLANEENDGEKNNEPQPLVLPDWIQPMMETHGYTAILPPQDSLDQIAKRNLRVLGSDSAVTNAILIKKDQWKVLEEESAEDEAEAKPKKKRSKKQIGSNNTLVSVCLEPVNKIKTITIPVAVDPLVISSVHLDATDERKRVLQLIHCLKRSRSLSDHYQGSNIRPLRAIIAGDMNAEFVPGSCMVATLQEYQEKKREALHASSDNDDEASLEVAACAEALRLTQEESPTAEQLKDWRLLRKEALEMVKDNCVSLDRIPTGPTRCAYEHLSGDGTGSDNTPDTPKRMQSWKLDHMLYDLSGGIRPLAYWATLEADPVSSQTGLPNATCPSDHLPIAAVFEIPSRYPPPNNNDSEKKSAFFLTKLQELKNRHSQVVDQAKAALKQKEQELKEKELEKEQAAAGTKDDMVEDVMVVDVEPGQKKKKKKRNHKGVPPSREIIELKRAFRSRLKVMQTNQAQERRDIVQKMGNWEKLMLQAHYGIPWRQWLEQGAS